MPQEIDPSPDIALIDVEKLTWPLMIRPWSEGDTFVPLGMRGKKKVSDLMIDSKIPLSLKEHVLVLESGGAIAWVVGLRLSDQFKIDPQTKSVLKISVNNAPAF